MRQESHQEEEKVDAEERERQNYHDEDIKEGQKAKKKFQEIRRT